MSSLGKAFVFFTGASMIGTLTQVIKGKISAVLLGTAGVGVLNQLTNLWSLFSILAYLGLHNGMVRHLSACWRDQERQAFNRHFSSNMLLVMAFALILTLLGCVFSPQLSHAILNDQGQRANLVCLILLSLPIFVAGQSYRALLSATKSVNLLVRARITADVLSVLVFLALVFPLGLQGAVLAYVGLHLLYLSAAFFLSLRSFKADLIVPKPTQFSPTEIQKNLGFGINSIVLLSVSVLTNLIVARWIFAEMSASDNGIFAMALKVASLYLSGLSAAAGGYYFPTLSGSKNLAEMHGHINKALGLYFIFIPPLIIGLLAGGELMIILLFSADFVPAAVLLLLILPADLFRITSETVGMAMVAKKKLIISTCAYVFWACLYLGLVAYLLPLHGLMGVALAYLISQICNSLIVLGLTWFSLSYRPNTQTLLTIAKGLALVAMMAILTWQRPGIISASLIGLALLAGWIAISWFDPDFKARALSLLGRFRLRPKD